ncbi:hypothetical protein SeLEV6574_g03076 [Synchytrium endobioticum]|uniref:Uncharacterized protein n=1 Tax=Synchytrium endobioticum TaxID=286115 RepID=A0A507D5M4_9FUNG|nr:hypothetical protein SeLEV6574_g03076 [Synchytrium endobioticum]
MVTSYLANLSPESIRLDQHHSDDGIRVLILRAARRRTRRKLALLTTTGTAFTKNASFIKIPIYWTRSPRWGGGGWMYLVPSRQPYIVKYGGDRVKAGSQTAKQYSLTAEIGDLENRSYSHALVVCRLALL